jgi:hypothetical protein
LGVLATVQGRPGDGIRFQVTALAMRLEIGSPQVQIDLHWLNRQRQALGQAAFTTALTELLDPDNVHNLLGLLDQNSQDQNSQDVDEG